MRAIAYIILLIFSVNLFAKRSITLNEGNATHTTLNSQIINTIINKAYNQLGVEVKRKKLPGDRALRMANSGEIDGLNARVKMLEDRLDNLIRVDIPVTIIENVAFTKDSMIAIDGWNSLTPYSLTTVRGTKIIEKNTKGMNVKLLTKLDQCFYMLDKDRVDLVIYDRLFGLEHISKKGLKGITIVEPPLHKIKLYHYLHKKNIDLVPDISKILKQMESSGEINQIRDNIIEQLQQRVR